MSWASSRHLYTFVCVCACVAKISNFNKFQRECDVKSNSVADRRYIYICNDHAFVSRKYHLHRREKERKKYEESRLKASDSKKKDQEDKPKIVTSIRLKNVKNKNAKRAKVCDRDRGVCEHFMSNLAIARKRISRLDAHIHSVLWNIQKKRNTKKSRRDVCVCVLKERDIQVEKCLRIKRKESVMRQN